MTDHQEARQSLFVAIDLGGTKIDTAVVDTRGHVISADYRPTEAAKGLDHVVARIVDAVSAVMNGAGVTAAQVSAVGIAAPGPVDVRSGVVTAPPNLPGWRDVPLRQIIEDRLGLPTALENDAGAAALAEHRFGAGRGTKNMIYVTASTGIGGGFILHGELYRGSTGAAGEVGHMIILPQGPRCGCGNRGCLEALASGTAIAREARELAARGVPTLVADLAEGDPNRMSAKLVAQAALQGDVEAQEILNRAMTFLGLGMANLVNLFNPELLIIGGGLTNMGERLFNPVRRAIDRMAFRAVAEAVEVVPAQLGDDVGVLGAATAAMLAQKTSL